MNILECFCLGCGFRMRFKPKKQTVQAILFFQKQIKQAKKENKILSSKCLFCGGVIEWKECH